MKRTKQESVWQSNSNVHVFIKRRLRRSVEDEAVALDGQSAGLRRDEERRGGLCVYVIDAQCSNTVKADGQCSPDADHPIITFLLLFLTFNWKHFFLNAMYIC